MIAFDEALQAALDLGRPLGSESVTLDEAFDRVLAAPAKAQQGSPLTDVSAMDGYAVRDADLGAHEVTLRLAGESRAGQTAVDRLEPGSCLRIFTGAPVPEGADRVVIQEEVARQGDAVVFRGLDGGKTHIRKAGSDFQAGDILVDAGSVLDAPRLVALAAADLGEVEVYRRPRVRLIATGDEIREPGAGGRGVPDSVSFGVAALVRAWGGEVVGRERHGDDLPTLERAAAAALDDADVVVVTGGASVGERDLARAMFAPSGLSLLVDKVAMKPGKPVWIGRCGDRIVVGLPGNPTSAMVTARLLLAPLVAGMAGRDAQGANQWRTEPLAADLPCCGDRETFVRAARLEKGINPLVDQDAAAQAPLAHCDVLLRRLPGAAAKAAGEPVLALTF